MTKNDKVKWLQYHTPGPYARARAESEKELDDETPVFCYCGMLATGLHTARCQKYQERLKTKIISKLKDMLPK